MEFVARQMQVPASEMESYDWKGRVVEYHRAQIREHLGFRECSVADAEKLTAYLAGYVAHKDAGPSRSGWNCWPAAGRRHRAAHAGTVRPHRGAALRELEESLTALISSRLTAESIERIIALVAGGTDDQDDAGPTGGGTEGEDAPPVLGKLKEAPGKVNLETMLTEIDKLLAVRAISLPRDLFVDAAPKVVAGGRGPRLSRRPIRGRTRWCCG